MKNLFIIFTLAFAAAKAQDAPQSAPPTAQQPTAGQVLSAHYSKTYQAALRYSDYDVAKSALYDLMVENPQNDSILYSLALIYYQSKNYASAGLVAKDLLTMTPDNLAAMEIAAVSFENIGAKDKALEQYETLYLKSDNFQILYKMAFLQYELKKYTESKTNADILLGKKETKEAKGVFNDKEGNQKEYPAGAALYNLKGLIALAEEDKSNAKSFFNKALEMAPDFQLAKQNLESLKTE